MSLDCFSRENSIKLQYSFFLPCLSEEVSIVVTVVHGGGCKESCSKGACILCVFAKKMQKFVNYFVVVVVVLLV